MELLDRIFNNVPAFRSVSNSNSPLLVEEGKSSISIPIPMQINIIHKNSDKEFSEGDDSEGEPEIITKYGLPEKETKFLEKIDDLYKQDNLNVTIEHLNSIYRKIFLPENDSDDEVDSGELIASETLECIDSSYTLVIQEEHFNHVTVEGQFLGKENPNRQIWVCEVRIESLKSNVDFPIEIRTINPDSNWICFNPPFYNKKRRDFSSNQKNLFHSKGIPRNPLWAKYAEYMDIEPCSICNENGLQDGEQFVILSRNIQSTIFLETVKSYYEIGHKIEKAISYCMRNNGGSHYKLSKKIFDEIKSISNSNIEYGSLSRIAFEVRRFDQKPWNFSQKELIEPDPASIDNDIKNETIDAIEPIQIIVKYEIYCRFLTQ